MSSSRRRRPFSAQPQRLSETASLLRRARGAGVDTTTMDLQRYCELQEQVDRVLSASPFLASTTVSALNNPCAAASRSTFEEADPPPSASLVGPAGSVTLDTIKRIPSLASLHQRSFANTHQSDSDPHEEAPRTTSGGGDVVMKGWIPLTVGSEPENEDPALAELLSHVDRRRALRGSYPPEAEDRKSFLMQTEAQQQHLTIYAFRERDVLPPDTAALLDSKAAVRDIVSRHEDRSTFKHNAEDELEEWAATLPRTAQSFDTMVAERVATLEHDQGEEQQALAAVEAGTVHLEAGLSQLNQFSHQMFDTIFEIEDQRAEIYAEELKARKRSHRSVGTTTVIVVPHSTYGVSTESRSGTAAAASATVPYGCRSLPEELFAPLTDDPQGRTSNSGGGAGHAASPRRQSYKPGTPPPPSIEPLDASALGSPLSTSVRCLTPTTTAAAGNGAGSSADGAIGQTLAAFHHTNALAGEIERLRRELERHDTEKKQHAAFARERMNVLASTITSLERVIEGHRQQIQNVFTEVSGLDVVWDEVGNGRSAADFLRDAIPVFADAVTQKTTSEISTTLLLQAKAEVREEVAELKREVVALQSQITASQNVHAEWNSNATKRHNEAQCLRELMERQLSDVNDELSRTRAALAKAKDEASTWKQDFLKRCDELCRAKEQAAEADCKRNASEKETAKIVQSAHKLAESVSQKLSAKFDEERKAFERQIADMTADKDALHNEQTSLMKRMEQLQRSLDDTRSRAIQRSVVQSVVDEIIHTFGSFVMQHIKRLRKSLLSDVGRALRSTCCDVCLQLVKAFQRGTTRTISMLEHHLGEDSCSRLRRVDEQCEKEVDACNYAVKGLDDFVDPIDTMMEAQRQSVASLEEALATQKLEREASEVHHRSAQQQHAFRMASALGVLKHLSSGVSSLLGSVGGKQQLHLQTWSSCPADLSDDCKDAIDGFSEWTPLLQLSTEIFHQVRHSVRMIATAPPLALHTSVQDCVSGTLVDTQLQSTLNDSNTFGPIKKGSFLAEFQHEFKNLREPLLSYSEHCAELPTSQQVGMATTTRVLATCRNALLQSITTFGDPLVALMTEAQRMAALHVTTPAGSRFHSPRSAHRSPPETPFGSCVPSTCVSPVGRPACGPLFPSVSQPTFVEHLPTSEGPVHRSSFHLPSSPTRQERASESFIYPQHASETPRISAELARKVDLAASRGLKAVQSIKIIYARSVWGVVRLAVVRNQLRAELDAIEARCSILSNQCELRVAAIKMERSRLQSSASPRNVGDEERLISLEESLRSLAKTRESLIDRFAERLRMFGARKQVAMQQAEAALVRQLTKVIAATRDAARFVIPFTTRLAAVCLVEKDRAQYGTLPSFGTLPRCHHGSLMPTTFVGGAVSPDRSVTPTDEEGTIIPTHDAPGHAIQMLLKRENAQLRQMLEELQLRQSHGRAAVSVDVVEDSALLDGGDPSCKKQPPPSHQTRRRQSATAASAVSPLENSMNSLGSATFGDLKVFLPAAAKRTPVRKRRSSLPGSTVVSPDASPTASPRILSRDEVDAPRVDELHEKAAFAFNDAVAKSCNDDGGSGLQVVTEDDVLRCSRDELSSKMVSVLHSIISNVPATIGRVGSSHSDSACHQTRRHGDENEHTLPFAPEVQKPSGAFYPSSTEPHHEATSAQKPMPRSTNDVSVQAVIAPCMCEVAVATVVPFELTDVLVVDAPRSAGGLEDRASVQPSSNAVATQTALDDDYCSARRGIAAAAQTVEEWTLKAVRDADTQCAADESVEVAADPPRIMDVAQVTQIKEEVGSEGGSPTGGTKFLRSRGLCGVQATRGEQRLHHPAPEFVLQGNNNVLLTRPLSASSSRLGGPRLAPNKHDSCVQTEVDLLVPLLMCWMQSTSLLEGIPRVDEVKTASVIDVAHQQTTTNMKRRPVSASTTIRRSTEATASTITMTSNAFSSHQSATGVFRPRSLAGGLLLQSKRQEKATHPKKC